MIEFTSFVSVSVASTTVSFVGPLLSWISSSETMSGERMLFTIWPASASNFDCGSAASRFSTLNVATESSFRPGAAVTSRARPLSTRVSTEVTSISKLPKS